MYPLGHEVALVSIMKYPVPAAWQEEAGLVDVVPVGQALQTLLPYTLYVLALQHTLPPSIALVPGLHPLQEVEPAALE